MAQLDRGTHLTREGAIAVLTMSNPGKRNAFSPEMRDDLIRHLETLQRDPSCRAIVLQGADGRSEEHTSELQSLMRISYAVFCLKKKKKTPHHIKTDQPTTHHRLLHLIMK